VLNVLLSNPKYVDFPVSVEGMCRSLVYSLLHRQTQVQSNCAPSGLLHRLALISDLQYADAPASADLNRRRHYRNTLKVLERAVLWWDKLGSIDLAVNLGDTIDGLNSAQGASEAALSAVLTRMHKGRNRPAARVALLGWLTGLDLRRRAGAVAAPRGQSRALQLQPRPAGSRLGGAGAALLVRRARPFRRGRVVPRGF
jgi:hypothetical protein